MLQVSFFTGAMRAPVATGEEKLELLQELQLLQEVQPVGEQRRWKSYRSYRRSSSHLLLLLLLLQFPFMTVVTWYNGALNERLGKSN